MEMRRREIPRFHEIIEDVETLSPEDQESLIEIVHRRLIQQKRADLAADIAEARQDYKEGRVRRGTVDDLMKELAG